MANLKLMLVILIVVMGFLLYSLYDFISSESYECLEAPINFGINKLGSDVECYCVNDRIMQKDHFGINNTDLWNIRKQSNISFILP